MLLNGILTFKYLLITFQIDKNQFSYALVSTHHLTGNFNLFVVIFDLFIAFGIGFECWPNDLYNLQSSIVLLATNY